MNIIEKIADDLALEQSYINSIIQKSSRLYKTYDIKKANGSPRHISQPTPELKTLQYWCVHNIFLHFPISDAAFAYIKGRSIKQNAQVHRKGKFILHLDIMNFFESIHSEHLKRLFAENENTLSGSSINLYDAQEIITKICLRHNTMSIGAVSSPAISNAVLYNFDKSLIAYANSHQLKYTRYADDMYFSSTSFIDPAIIQFVEEQLREIGLKLNRNKTHFMSSNNRKLVTGLTLTHDNKVSVGLATRKKVKSLLYNKMVHGAGDSKQIIGYLAFLKDVEPQYYNKIIIKYSAYGNVFEKLAK